MYRVILICVVCLLIPVTLDKEFTTKYPARCVECICLADDGWVKAMVK